MVSVDAPRCASRGVWPSARPLGRRWASTKQNKQIGLWSWKIGFGQGAVRFERARLAASSTPFVAMCKICILMGFGLPSSGVLDCVLSVGGPCPAITSSLWDRPDQFLMCEAVMHGHGRLQMLSERCVTFPSVWVTSNSFNMSRCLLLTRTQVHLDYPGIARPSSNPESLTPASSASSVTGVRPAHWICWMSSSCSPDITQTMLCPLTPRYNCSVIKADRTSLHAFLFSILLPASPTKGTSAAPRRFTCLS